MIETAVPGELRVAVEALRAGLAASSFTVGAELVLAARPVEPWSHRRRALVSGASVRLDVVDEVDGSRTAVRVYEESVDHVGTRRGASVVLSEWWFTIDSGLPVEGFGEWLRTSASDDSDPRPSAASNAEVSELVRVASRTRYGAVLGADPEVVRAALEGGGVVEEPVVLVLEHALALEDGASSDVLAVATRVLTALADGAPVEWAVRREAGWDS